MIVLTERHQVRSVVKRWREQYGYIVNDPSKDVTSTRSRLEILRELEVLDLETASAADVAAIIGNTSWAHPVKCDECGKRSWSCVQLGEDADYDSSFACVCPDCLQSAIALATSEAT